MLTVHSFQKKYPNLAIFASKNSYIRTSHKGKKHLVKNNRKRNLMLAGGISSALLIGGLAIYKRDRSLLKKARTTINKTSSVTAASKPPMSRTNSISASKPPMSKKTYESIKETAAEIQKIGDRVRAGTPASIPKRNPAFKTNKELDDFMASSKKLVL